MRTEQEIRDEVARLHKKYREHPGFLQMPLVKIKTREVLMDLAKLMALLWVLADVVGPNEPMTERETEMDLQYKPHIRGYYRTPKRSK